MADSENVVDLGLKAGDSLLNSGSLVVTALVSFIVVLLLANWVQYRRSIATEDRLFKSNEKMVTTLYELRLTLSGNNNGS